MDQIREAALKIYAAHRRAHHEAFTTLVRLKETIARGPKLEQSVDVVALLKKSEEFAKDSRRELEKAIKQLSKVACHLYLRTGMTEPNIKTDWVTATPDVKSQPKLPKRDENPEAYDALCKHFGIPEEVMLSQTFRPHWPAMKELVSKLESEFKPLPPGLTVDDKQADYSVACRWKRDIDPDVLCEELNHEQNQARTGDCNSETR